MKRVATVNIIIDNAGNMMKVSDYVIKFLVSKGVKDVFLLTGGGAMHLNDSLGRSKDLSYTCFLHEQALAIACEAYAQFTNFPGVGMVTSGPGSTNTVTGVTAAYFDSTPCVFISGQAKSQDLKLDSGVRQMGCQEVDIVSIVSSITKYAVTVLDPTEIRFHLEKAWHEATSGRMGPVWIDIPLDIQGAQIEEGGLRGFEASAPTAKAIDTKQIENFIQSLNEAKRPVILAGSGVKLAGAEEALFELANSQNIPILTTWKVLDLMDYDHPLNFGCPGIMGSRFANFIVQSSDLLLILGSRLESSVTAFDTANFGRNAKKIMVDIDECEIRKVSGIDSSFVADVNDWLSEIIKNKDKLEQTNREKWLSYCSDLKERYPVVLEEYYQETEGVNLYAFTDTLCNHLEKDEIITPESSGAAGEITYQAFRVKQGQKMKNAAGLGAMGFGLPYAIGASIANQGKRTILINGDGAFQLNIQELETAMRLKLPLKIFILENDGYASIRGTQTRMFDGFFVGSSSSTGLSLPDLKKVAGAYNFRYESISSNSELNDVIKKVLSGPDAVICSVQVIETQQTLPRVQAMKLPDGKMISKPIEDMWPYLPEDEIKSNLIG